MRVLRVPVLIAPLVLVAACMADRSMMGPDAEGMAADAPIVLSIRPTGTDSLVDPASPITISFSHAMMIGMEMLVVVHQGSVTGAQVVGTSAWSAERTTLVFTPEVPLQSQTTYVIHLAPSLRGTNGMMINMSRGTARGGRMVTSSMMGGSTNGGMMSGGHWGPGMSGTGWQDASGMMGMVFAFTTR